MKSMLPIAAVAIYGFALFTFYELIIHGHPYAAAIPAMVVLFMKISQGSDKEGNKR